MNAAFKTLAASNSEDPESFPAPNMESLMEMPKNVIKHPSMIETVPDFDRCLSCNLCTKNFNSVSLWRAHMTSPEHVTGTFSKEDPPGRVNTAKPNTLTAAFLTGHVVSLRGLVQDLKESRARGINLETETNSHGYQLTTPGRPASADLQSFYDNDSNVGLTCARSRSPPVFTCEICDISFGVLKFFDEHLHSATHVGKLELVVEGLHDDAVCAEDCPVPVPVKGAQGNYCNICDNGFETKILLLSHFASSAHMKRVLRVVKDLPRVEEPKLHYGAPEKIPIQTSGSEQRRTPAESEGVEEEFQLSCKFCDISFNTVSALSIHSLSERHRLAKEDFLKAKNGKLPLKPSKETSIDAVVPKMIPATNNPVKGEQQGETAKSTRPTPVLWSPVESPAEGARGVGSDLSRKRASQEPGRRANERTEHPLPSKKNKLDQPEAHNEPTARVFPLGEQTIVPESPTNTMRNEQPLSWESVPLLPMSTESTHSAFARYQPMLPPQLPFPPPNFLQPPVAPLATDPVSVALNQAAATVFAEAFKPGFMQRGEDDPPGANLHTVASLRILFSQQELRVKYAVCTALDDRHVLATLPPLLDEFQTRMAVEIAKKQLQILQMQNLTLRRRSSAFSRPRRVFPDLEGTVVGLCDSFAMVKRQVEQFEIYSAAYRRAVWSGVQSDAKAYIISENVRLLDEIMRCVSILMKVNGRPDLLRLSDKEGIPTFDLPGPLQPSKQQIRTNPSTKFTDKQLAVLNNYISAGQSPTEDEIRENSRETGLPCRLPS